MSPIETQINQLKAETVKMFNLLIRQVSKSQEAMLDFDKDLSREVIVIEDHVNSFELKLDRDCENLLALYNPLAIDLRLVLAVLKINSNLERIGDIASGIAKFVIRYDKNFDERIIERASIMPMFKTCLLMLHEVKDAFEKEDTQISRKVFKQDEFLDEINKNAIKSLTEHVQKHPEDLEQAFYMMAIILKLERVGDQIKNIAEEIIFYIEAKVLKHTPKKQEKK
ncbi:phosphate signaling complex protein PhoU [Daejeonella oryzae]|uniref:phosphate signaling complex protein PhoU n=1 Tax=Daejeonella oryzae TaxID=1122943 RepID=UPI00041D0E69|nr:phosphate signaling complex protein PhoU [Daejeonella oryzae]